MSLIAQFGTKELTKHQEFATSGTHINAPGYKRALVVLRDNIHLTLNETTNGYINNPGQGIILTEPIRTDNPAGGETITIFYEKTTA